MEQWAPTAAMVATNVVIAVMTALIKQALSLGMNRLVLITFRQMVATLFLGPIAYFKERYEGAVGGVLWCQKRRANPFQ